MKAANFTYEDVMKVCTDLLSIGQRPTVKTIRAELGGSNSRILKFLQQWQEQERRKTEAQGLELSSKSFQEAINAELAFHTQKSRESFAQELKEFQSREIETRALLEAAEIGLFKVEEEKKELENNLHTQKSLFSSLNEKVESLKKELELERKISENSRIELAEVKANLKYYDALVAENKELNKLLRDLEKKLSASEAKVEVLAAENKKVYAIIEKKLQEK